MNRVRFAPAPTGFLHIGGARTYIFNWLFARSTGGQMVLRIDDTDTVRNTEESVESILDGLRWMELPWDEQHNQSDRLKLHLEAAAYLLEKGLAYRDFTPEKSKPAKEEEAGDKKSSRVPWLCNPQMRELTPGQSAKRAVSGEPFVLRYRVPRERPDGVKFKDLVFRKQFRKFTDIEDFALLRSNGQPTYHLASSVDDGDLKISHVIRGQDHLTNTYKHIMLLESLGYNIPEFGHLPLLLGPDGSKLSKRRHGKVVSVINYRDMGFLSVGLVNYLSLLGWSPKDNREVMTVEELKATFQLEQVLRTNAVVQFGKKSQSKDIDPKAIWLNGQHLRKLPIEQILPVVENQLKELGWWDDAYAGPRKTWFCNAVNALRSRLNMLSEFSYRCRAYFQDDFEIDAKALANLDKESVRGLLHNLADRLETTSEFTEESVERELRALAELKGVNPGLLINGSRAALTGQPVGPSAFQVFTLIGKLRTINRLRAV